MSSAKRAKLRMICGIWAYYLAGTAEAIVGGFPFQGNILFSYGVSVQIPDHGHICGGGIIADRFVLTAAHCVLNQTRHLRNTHMIVLARIMDLNKTGPPVVAIPVEKVFFPREFHPMVVFSHGDIAVLKLKEPLPVDDRAYLQKLQLPRNYRPPSSIAAIAGFGWSKFHSVNNVKVFSSDGRLHFAMPNVLTDDECEQSFPHGAIESGQHLCAAMQERHSQLYGVCSGDGGSPLASGLYVIGILSKIPPHCDEREKPGIYTRVAHYARMILHVMENGRDPDMTELFTSFGSA